MTSKVAMGVMWTLTLCVTGFIAFDRSRAALHSFALVLFASRLIASSFLLIWIATESFALKTARCIAIQIFIVSINIFSDELWIYGHSI